MSSSSIIRRAEIQGQAWLVGEGDGYGLETCTGNPPALVAMPAEEFRRAREEVLERVRQEAEELRRAAWQAGYDQGAAAGREAAAREAEEPLHRLLTLAREARVDTGEWLRDTEDELVALALDVARRVIGAELATGSGAAVEMVRAALSEIDAGTIVRIRVSPADWELLTAWWTESVSADQRREIELLADPDLEAGGCLVETRAGGRDARTGTRLAEVARALLREAEVPS